MKKGIELPSLWWTDIDGYKGLYQVSVNGEMRSLDRWVNDKRGVKRLLKGRILKPGKNNHGYLTVALWKDGKGKTYSVHRLVAQAFIPNPNNLPEVNHKDENPLNNRVENLEWCTAKYNTNYGTVNQRRAEALTNGKTSKPVVALNKREQIVHVFSSAAEAGRNGYNQQSVSACCRGEMKRHHGLIWRYQNDFLKKIC